MCRYAMIKYKPHYVCFECRKTFKRRLLCDITCNEIDEEVEAKCPQLMANIGKDFKAPSKNNIKDWEHIKLLYSVGITFHSCGCSGPGYIPNTKDQLTTYFEEIKKEYIHQLNFWRNRTEPTQKSEIDRDKSKNWNFIGRIPYECRTNKGFIKNEDAKNYWIAKVKAINEQLEKINATK